MPSDSRIVALTYLEDPFCHCLGRIFEPTVELSVFELLALPVLLEPERPFFFQAEDGIRDSVASRGLGDVYKRQDSSKTMAEWILEVSKRHDSAIAWHHECRFRLMFLVESPRFILHRYGLPNFPTN